MAGTTGDLVVAVPSSWPGERSHSLLMLVGWLVRELPEPPVVVCWDQGPMVARFGELAPTIEVGGVNRGAVPRALETVRLRPVARRAKSVAVRRLLRPVRHARNVVCGGTGVLGLLGWLDPTTPRAVTLWCDDPERDGGTSWNAVAECASDFLVGDDTAATSLTAAGVAEARVHRVGEPLVTLASSRVHPHGGTGPDAGLVALLGARVDDDTAAAVAGLITGAGPTTSPAVAWVHEGGDPGWDRWLDERFHGWNGRIVDWVDAECLARADDVLAAVVLTSSAHPLALALAGRGVPVLSPGAPATGTVPVDGVLGAVAAVEQLRASADARRTARHEARLRTIAHDCDRAGDLLLDLHRTVRR